MTPLKILRWLPVCLLLSLAGCAQPPPRCPDCPVCPPAASKATPAATLQAVAWSDLPGWEDDHPDQAWPALLESCRAWAGKPQEARWNRVCAQAVGFDASQPETARRFFETYFQPYAVRTADGASGLITGYYEPLLRGSRKRSGLFRHPVHGVPDDLVSVELGSLYPELKSLRLKGRLSGNKLLPYPTRAEIFRQGEAFPAPVLLWVDDAVELFFLQVQGSGRVALPDGSEVRLGYADQNGHPYQSIGRLLVERKALKLEEASMQGIQAWGRAHPERLPELLNANPSYVFFREMSGKAGSGPVGALGVPLTPQRSIAVDPRHIPLGAPVFVSTTRPGSQQPLNRLVFAQDTGGAIKGALRADFFWGFGPEAGAEAGRMRQTGALWVLLPKE